MSEFRIVERVPTADEYARMRAVVGWNEVDPQGIARGLHNALFSLCLLDDDDVIGCARIVGDDGLYFYIQDVIVLPEYQGQGLGRRLMDRVMAYIEQHAKPGAFIGLMAAKDVAPFYHKYGFAERPVAQPGMYRMWEGKGECGTANSK
ncbi:MAG: GNAT family N-acetyltransferase [Phycisphaerales bacterium]|nr:MAG: GNAT family N-acetyltransferase [Phycisphaerales bacterium]